MQWSIDQANTEPDQLQSLRKQAPVQYVANDSKAQLGPQFAPECSSKAYPKSIHAHDMSNSNRECNSAAVRQHSHNTSAAMSSDATKALSPINTTGLGKHAYASGLGQDSQNNGSPTRQGSSMPQFIDHNRSQPSTSGASLSVYRMTEPLVTNHIHLPPDSYGGAKTRDDRASDFLRVTVYHE